MVLGAGQVLEQVAVDLRRHHAQLDHRAVVGDGRDPVFAPRCDLGHPVLGDERLGGREPVGHRGDDVDVLPGLGEPAQATGGLAPDDGFAAARAPSRSARPAAGAGRSTSAAPRRRHRPSAPRGSPPRSSRPIPPIPRIRCASAASRTWSTVSRPSSVKIRRAVFGPMPGMRITVVAPGGLRFTSLSSAAISPLPSSSATLAATVSPTPGSVVSRPSPRAAPPTRRSPAATSPRAGRRARDRRPRPPARAGPPSARTGRRSRRSRAARGARRHDTNAARSGYRVSLLCWYIETRMGGLNSAGAKAAAVAVGGRCRGCRRLCRIRLLDRGRPRRRDAPCRAQTWRPRGPPSRSASRTPATSGATR